jgi:Trk K+ transport system NAD-binding subunit
VSVGIGEIAKGLGLTDTAGAFAAGVLLANTNYRAQIQADILPFKGILLGIFFMDAGSSFDTDTVLNEMPTVLTGAFALIFFKAVTLFLATRVPEWIERNRLPLADGIRLALLLAGGGEFAFVVLALAEKLGVLPSDLGSLLTAIVLITMAVTPFLGQLADIVSQPFTEEAQGAVLSMDGITESEGTEIAEDAIVVCGYGEIGESCLQVLYEEYRAIKEYVEKDAHRDLPHIVAFDSNPALAGNILMPSEDAVVLFGDGSNPAVLQSSGITKPSAVFVCYQQHQQVSSATARLRSSFPRTPIYARAQTRGEAEQIKALGATEVVIEADELPRSATAFIWSSNLISRMDKATLTEMRLKRAASVASGVPIHITDGLFELYQCVDQDLSGQISAEELANLISKSNAGVHSDAEVGEMVAWIRETVATPLDIFGFCRFYTRSPPAIRKALEDACLF